MREIHQTNLIAFRAGDRLASAIFSAANEAGVSVSEWLRTAARERVGLQ